jgi:hypothetical protein
MGWGCRRGCKGCLAVYIPDLFDCFSHAGPLLATMPSYWRREWPRSIGPTLLIMMTLGASLSGQSPPPNPIAGSEGNPSASLLVAPTAFVNTTSDIPTPDDVCPNCHSKVPLYNNIYDELVPIKELSRRSTADVVKERDERAGANGWLPDSLFKPFCCEEHLKAAILDFAGNPNQKGPNGVKGVHGIVKARGSRAPTKSGKLGLRVCWGCNFKKPATTTGAKNSSGSSRASLGTTGSGCSWQITAEWTTDMQWVISGFYLEHNHDLPPLDQGCVLFPSVRHQHGLTPEMVAVAEQLQSMKMEPSCIYEAMHSMHLKQNPGRPFHVLPSDISNRFGMSAQDKAMDVSGLVEYLENRSSEKNLRFKVHTNSTGALDHIIIEMPGGADVWDALCKPKEDLRDGELPGGEVFFDTTFKTNIYGLKFGAISMADQEFRTRIVALSFVLHENEVMHALPLTPLPCIFYLWSNFWRP